MKPRHNLFLGSFLVVTTVIGLGTVSHADNVTWDVDAVTTGAQDGGGTWTAGGAGWWNTTTLANDTWTNGDVATFGSGSGSAGTHAITLGSDVIVGALPNKTTLDVLLFNTPGNYTISAASAQTIQINNIVDNGTGCIKLGSGVTATIGDNVSLRRLSDSTGGQMNIYGGATAGQTNGGKLVIGTGVDGANAVFENLAVNLTEMREGATVEVKKGGTFTSAGTLVVGTAATSPLESNFTNTLQITGGTVNVSSSAGKYNLVIGNAGNVAQMSTAIVTLSDGALNINSATSGLYGLRFGASVANTSYVANATFHLDGGVLTVGRIYDAQQTGAGAGTVNSTFNFNGGELKVLTGTNNAAVFMAGLDAAQVRNGGAKINTNGVNTTIGQALIHSTIVGENATDGGLEKRGAGTLTLTGINSYTGATTIKSGTLALDFTAIANASGNQSNHINSSSVLELSGGTLSVKGVGAGSAISSAAWTGATSSPVLTFTALPTGVVVGQAVTGTGIPGSAYVVSIDVAGKKITLNGNATATSGGFTTSVSTPTTNQTFASTTLGTNSASSVSVDANSGGGTVLNLNAITRNAGATLNFTLPAGTQSATNGITTTTTNTNGLLGNGLGWATVGGTDFATNSTNAAGGNIVAYSGYADVTRQSSGTKQIADGATTNVRIVEGTPGAAADVTLAANATINTLNQSASGGTGAATIDPQGYALAVNSILVGTGAGGLTIGNGTNNGTLKSAGSELLVIGNAATTINSVIANGTAASTLVKAGSATLTLAGTNTYTGNTTITSGTLALTGTGSIASSPVISVKSGATLDVGGVTGGWSAHGSSSSSRQTLTGAGNVTGATTIGGFGTHNAGDGGVGAQAFSSSLNYASGSIFEWDLNANSTASGFDTVSAVGNIDVDTTATVFKVLFGTGVDLSNPFWSTPNTTRTWSMTSIFGKAFNSGSFADVTSTADPITQGSFTISGSSLTWTAVPEPTSALVGLLITAGLLRRRRGEGRENFE